MSPRFDAVEGELAIPLRLLDSEAGCFSLFVWHNVLIAAWASQATGSAVQRIDVATSPLMKEHPEGVSVIHLVKDRTGMPTAEARAGFLESMKVNARSLQCVSVVLLGGGFWASTLQSIVTGMRMLAPNSFTMRIDNGFDTVIHWLPPEHLRRTGVSLRPNELKTAMTEAFSRMTKDAERSLAGEPSGVAGTHGASTKTSSF